MAGRPETKQYWIDQLSEYWDSGLTIQEYCELKEVSYESARRWIALLKKEREGQAAEKHVVLFAEAERAENIFAGIIVGSKAELRGVLAQGAFLVDGVLSRNHETPGVLS